MGAQVGTKAETNLRVGAQFLWARRQMDRRFDAFTTLTDRFMIWSLCTTVATGGIVIGALKVWL
jgi:nitrate reductase gamma subunit